MPQFPLLCGGDGHSAPFLGIPWELIEEALPRVQSSRNLGVGEEQAQQSFQAFQRFPELVPSPQYQHLING